jgi:hypothetical protein
MTDEKPKGFLGKHWRTISAIIGLVVSSVFAQVESCNARRQAERAVISAKQAQQGGAQTAGRVAYADLELQSAYKVIVEKVTLQEANIGAIHKLLEYNSERIGMIEQALLSRRRGYEPSPAPSVIIGKSAPLPTSTNAAVVQSVLNIDR